MAKPLSLPEWDNREGGWYHVMSRGIKRRWIFDDDVDRNRIRFVLGELEGDFTVCKYTVIA